PRRLLRRPAGSRHRVPALGVRDGCHVRNAGRQRVRSAGCGGGEKARPLRTLTPAELRNSARSGDYLGILAYVPPTPAIFAQLQELRATWGRALGCATTLGIGPRYLHSTGQLHKGGPASGLFLVITTDV